MKLSGRSIYAGAAQGEALVTTAAISFYGGVDPDSGVIVERGHPLGGQSTAGKVLVFPTGKGSTVGSYTLYRMKANGVAPAAIINAECETITAVGCIIAEIPCVDRIDLSALRSGQRLAVDAAAATVEILAPAMPPPNRPPVHLPEPLRGADRGSFAEAILTYRLPGIAQRVLDETDWPIPARERLEALIADMPGGRLRPLDDPEAPDAALWQGWMAPFVGLTWLEAPWFAAEIYFFRRILEATGYYRPGGGREVDPFRPQKLQALAEAAAPLAQALETLEAPINGFDDLQAQSAQRLRAAVWGNQADLAVFPTKEFGGAAGHMSSGAPRTEEHLVVDDADAVAAFLEAQRGANGRVDFLLDNGGMELGYDLLLADFLLENDLAGQVIFHAKPHPTYVSDVIPADVPETLETLSAAGQDGLRRLAGRLQRRISEDRLRIQTEYFWISPLAGWEMPGELYAELAGAQLIISKGDANYRRWLNDRHWPFTTPFAAATAYRPAALLALRVFKANVLAGLPAGRQAELDRLDPQWLYNGKWGVIQFAA